MTLASEIEDFARSRGAELFGVTSAEPFTGYIETVAELNSIHGLKGIPQLSKRINESVGDPKNILPDAQSIIVLGVFCTAAAHSLFIKGMRYVKAQTASITHFLEPVYGIILAFFFLREIPSLRTILGGGIVLMAAIAATLTSRPSFSRRHDMTYKGE